MQAWAGVSGQPLKDSEKPFKTAKNEAPGNLGVGGLSFAIRTLRLPNYPTPAMTAGNRLRDADDPRPAPSRQSRLTRTVAYHSLGRLYVPTCSPAASLMEPVTR